MQKGSCEKTQSSFFTAPELEKVRSKIYGVLSKGIHESSEEECKYIFLDVKTAIDMILEKILEEKERTKKINSLNKKI